MLRALCGLTVLAAGVSASGQQVDSSLNLAGNVVQEVAFDQKLDAQVPLDLVFRDENGDRRPLSEFVRDRPVVLALVYFRCPMLCSQNLNGLVRSLKPLSFSVGEQFNVITVSIDPKDTSEMAGRKKAGYVGRYGRPESAPGWHFLTGDRDEIERLARTVGFRYVYNPQTDLYAHAAGIVILTPQGRVARYLYGIDYPSKDLQFALMDASAGRIGSPIARVLLLCYDYDPNTGRYTLTVMKTVRAMGVLTFLVLASFVTTMLLRERRLNRHGEPPRTPPQPAAPSNP